MEGWGFFFALFVFDRLTAFVLLTVCCLALLCNSLRMYVVLHFYVLYKVLSFKNLNISICFPSNSRNNAEKIVINRAFNLIF